MAQSWIARTYYVSHWRVTQIFRLFTAKWTQLWNPIYRKEYVPDSLVIGENMWQSETIKYFMISIFLFSFYFSHMI